MGCSFLTPSCRGSQSRGPELYCRLSPAVWRAPDYLAAQGDAVFAGYGRVAESASPGSRRWSCPNGCWLSRAPDLPWFQGFNPQQEEQASLYLLTIDGRVGANGPGAVRARTAL